VTNCLTLWKLAGLLILGLCLSVPAAGITEGVLLGVDVESIQCGTSTLIAIDVATGVGTEIGPITGFPCVQGLSFSPTGTLYGVSSIFFGGGGTGDLIIVDPLTGNATAVGPVGFTVVDDLAVAPDGTIFAVVQPGGPTAGGPALAKIDPNTGAGTIIGPIGSCVEGLSFAPDGTLFGAADIFNCSSAQTLIEIDTTTGAGTIIGPIGFNDVDAISFTSDGVLIGANLVTDVLFTIDPTTGASTTIGPTGFNWITALASPRSSISISINIDIKPGGFPNSINPRSKGLIPVAILSTSAFDATTVDPTTVRFGAAGTEAPAVKSAEEDVDGDGDTDLILHFNTQQSGIQCGHTSASLTGATFSGQKIEGSDSIKTAGCPAGG
jgi:hypothetical protein